MTRNPMITKSFKKGFAQGFSAPFLFFAPLTIRRPAQFNGSVAEAWSDVGRALNEATQKQGATIEQKPRTKAPSRNRRHQAA